jgi:FKBP-type peptidyl-prolyl cis-trans isomerase FklB
MKKSLLTFVAALLFVAPIISQTNQKMDSVSYSLGVLVAQNFKNGEKVDIDATSMAQGFSDVLNGKETINAQKANEIFSSYMQRAQMKKFEVKLAEGKKFLEENGKRAGVTTTASGLQYEIMVAGTGPKPTSNDKVTVHYHGTLLNGKVFDSSVQRGQTIDFPVTGVISGWVEALQLMPMGSKWKLFIPYNLAYGERGAGGDIGPYETLVFEVELIKIN